MEFLATLLYSAFMFIYSLVPEEKSDPIPCSGEVVQTKMGEICVWSKEPEQIKGSYMGVYLGYLEEKFDPTVVPYEGRKYSNKKLYCIYRYVIHRDGSIHDLKIEVPQNEQFDNHVKKLILDNPPAPFLEGMPDEVKVELVVKQTPGGSSSGGPGNLWHDYYIIDFQKGSEIR